MHRILLFIYSLFCTVCVFSQTVNVGVMLPLHDVDGDGRRMVEYYRGILMAVDQLKQDGMNVNVHAWNVPIDADPRPTLLQKGAKECNVIFGPLYTKQVKLMGDFCKSYGIKMVIPPSRATMSIPIRRFIRSIRVLTCSIPQPSSRWQNTSQPTGTPFSLTVMTPPHARECSLSPCATSLSSVA